MKKKIFEKPLGIYCVLFGHTYFITHFFGYQYCGRCGTQIGDTLGSTGIGKCIPLTHHRINCKNCNKIRRRLTGLARIYMPLQEKFLRWYNK